MAFQPHGTAEASDASIRVAPLQYVVTAEDVKRCHIQLDTLHFKKTPSETAYSLGGADADSFEIDSETGQLKTKAPIDYETQNTYTVTVTATDAGSLSAEITVTVEVTDIAEYLWSLPPGYSLIHVPLRVTAVDGVPKTLETVGDVYDALGGSAHVNLLITRDAVGNR